MSRHLIHTVGSSGPVHVVIGYDRPLREFFVQVWPAGAGVSADQPIASSLDDPCADWRDIETVKALLRRFGVGVPMPMIEAVETDAACNAGNRIVRHDLHRAPEILAR